MLDIAATIDVTDSPEGPVLHIGDGVGVDAGPLERVLAGVAATRPQVVSIHLDHLSVLTSQLIRVFVSFHTRVARGGGRVRLVRPHAGVRDDLLRLRLDNLFQIAGSGLEVNDRRPAPEEKATQARPMLTRLRWSPRLLRAARLQVERRLVQWGPRLPRPGGAARG